MAKYRLKDQVLQKKLDDLSDGDFSRQLNEESLDGCSPDFTFRVRFGGQVGTCFRYSAVFRVDEIMIQEGYDPNAWNNYPETQPPMDLHMRVETATGFKCCAEFDGENWMYRSIGENRVQGLRVLKNVVRYRPWSKP